MPLAFTQEDFLVMTCQEGYVVFVMHSNIIDFVHKKTRWLFFYSSAWEIYIIFISLANHNQVFHDKIKFYILRQNLHETCFNDFQMWNGAWNKLQFKVCQVAHGSVAYLDKHSTLDPVMVSVVSSNPTGGNFLKFFKLLDVNSGLKCKCDLIVKNSNMFVGWKHICKIEIHSESMMMFLSSPL